MERFLFSRNFLVFGIKSPLLRLSICSDIRSINSTKYFKAISSKWSPIISRSVLGIRFSSKKGATMKSSETEKWKVLYKFPGIKYVRLISRFKVYQILLMSGLCYPLYLQYINDVVTSGLFYSAVGGCIGTSVVFILFSYFSTKIIGQLSINEAEHQVRLSRLNFYGTRCEDFISTEDLVPWVDVASAEDLNKVFQKLYVEQGEAEHVYIYTLKYGQISEKSQFLELLGLPSLSKLKGS